MTASILAFLWGWGAASATATASSAPLTVDIVLDKMGGHNRAPAAAKRPPKYTQVDEDFWDVREAYLRSLVSRDEEPAPIDSQPAAPVETAFEEEKAPQANPVDITEFVQKRADLIQELRNASTLGQLKSVGARLAIVNELLRRKLEEQQKQADQKKERQKRLLAIRIAKRKAAMELAKLVSQPLGRKTEETT